MFSKFFLLTLYLIPKNFLSKFLGFIANKSISRLFINPFIKIYKVDILEAKETKFSSFNKFFTRLLKKELRPIAQKDNNKIIVSPVDGTLIQYGQIKENILIQVKGKNYSLTELLIDSHKSQLFTNGYFMTIYLAPADYHRIHSPISGEIYSLSYTPGHLFPVNNFSMNHIDNLFCTNERITSFLRNENKELAIVKVGATVVGKIKVNYDKIESNKTKKIVNKTIKEKKIKKGEEIGLFELGSTVILLFNNKSKLRFKSNLKIKKEKKIKLKFGEEIGTWE